MPTRNGTHGDGATAVKDIVSQQGSAIKEQTATTIDTAKDKVLEKVDERKDQLVDQAQSVHTTLDKIADDLAQDGMERPADWLRQAADSFDRMVTSVEQKDAQQLIQDARRAASSQPLIFAGAMMGLGFAAARLFSASKQPEPITYNNSEPDWPTMNNPAPYARMDDVDLAGSPYGDV